jgi:hypothetical protein
MEIRKADGTYRDILVLCEMLVSSLEVGEITTGGRLLQERGEGK